MSEAQSPVPELDLELISEYYAVLERQGPGSPEATLKALSFVRDHRHISHVADIGCGTGAHTLLLATHLTGSRITALDLLPAFIERLNINAAQAGLNDRVKGIVGSMEELPFEPDSLDMIWSEGAIYNMGFERGLREWRAFLKTGGYLAVSELTWLTQERPAELQDYWLAAYPEINTASAKLAQLEAAGYAPKAAFVIPESCWTDHYYAPQVAVREAFLKKHACNPAVKAFIENDRAEAELYERFKQYYGYVFYIGQKV